MKKNNTEPSGRKKQIQAFFIVFALFVLFVVIISVTSNQGSSEEDETTTVETTTVADETETTETTTTITTTVTGSSGQNNTMIPATVEAIKSTKVITVNRLGESVDVALIGISVSDELADAEMERLNELIPVGTEVYIMYDESTYNSSGQELCYIWLTNEITSFYNSNLVKQYMVQGILIAEGLAESQSEYPNSRFEDAFETIDKGY